MGGWGAHRRNCIFAVSAWPLIVLPAKPPSRDQARGNPHENRDGSRSSGLGRGVAGFWNKVQPDGTLAPGECWIWTGYLDRNGAGKFCTLRGGRQVSLRAARVAWEAQRGPIPADKVVFADCGNPACVNPDHRRLIDRTAVRVSSTRNGGRSSTPTTRAR